MLTRHLRIHGRVQGVGFRESMRREAVRLKLAGWVRNLPDGSVEAVVQGDPESVEAVIVWSRTGPLLARVDRVDIAPAEGRFTGFDTLPSPVG